MCPRNLLGSSAPPPFCYPDSCNIFLLFTLWPGGPRSRLFLATVEAPPALLTFGLAFAHATPILGSHPHTH